MSIDDYLALDVADGSDRYVRLLDRAPSEIRRDEISLTSEQDADAASPPFLTGQMSHWYHQHVASPRNRALGSLESQFKAIHTRRGQEGIFLEAEIDRLAQEKWRNIQYEYDQFAASMEVANLRERLEDKRDAYERKRAANGGEDSHAWNRVLYVFLLLVIATPELFLNFESVIRTLRTYGLASPALAVGLTLALMFGIGMSSHVVGVSLHQWGDRFGGHVSRSEKWRHTRFFGMGWLLFFVAIGIVTYGRYLLFSDELERALLTGRTTSTGAVFQIAYTVGGNILIWLLGIVIAMLAHDRVDGLGEAKRAYEQANRKYSAKYKSDLEQRVERHINAEQQKNAHLKEFEKRDLRPLPEYSKLRHHVDMLLAKDSVVVGTLEAYRQTLLAEINDNDAGTVFQLNDISDARSGGLRKLTPLDYSALKLHLPRA